jgi:hypothetical protein
MPGQSGIEQREAEVASGNLDVCYQPLVAVAADGRNRYRLPQHEVTRERSCSRPERLAALGAVDSGKAHAVDDAIRRHDIDGVAIYDPRNYPDKGTGRC